MQILPRNLTKSKWDQNHQVCLYVSIYDPFETISEYILMFVVKNTVLYLKLECR
jgi:hypothetical protein